MLRCEWLLLGREGRDQRQLLGEGRRGGVLQREVIVSRRLT